MSLFSGLGGADLGVYLASKLTGVPVEIVFAADSWGDAVSIYNANLPHPVGRVSDVKILLPEDLPEHDLVVGGPPCQSFSMAGKRLGFDDPRNCVPDFIRLTRGGRTPFVMENVVGGLLAHYGVFAYEYRFKASDYGDVTSRQRFYYTNIAPWGRNDDPDTLFAPVLRVMDRDTGRRYGSIKDHGADHEYIGKARAAAAQREQSVEEGASVRKKGDTREVRYAQKGFPTYSQDDLLPSLTAHSWHGHDERSSVKLVQVTLPLDLRIETLPVTYSADGTRRRIDDAVADMLAAGRSEIADDGVFGTFTETSYRGPNRSGSGRPNANSFVPVFASSVAMSADEEARVQELMEALIGDDEAAPTESAIAEARAIAIAQVLGTWKQPGDYTTMMRDAIARGRRVETVGEKDVFASMTSRTPNGIVGGKCLITVTSETDTDEYRLHPLTGEQVVGVRCPSILEMQRAHSIPDEWNWNGMAKEKRGKMVANCWPTGMATSVLAPVLRRLAALD